LGFATLFFFEFRIERILKAGAQFNQKKSHSEHPQGCSHSHESIRVRPLRPPKSV
jgi:hypothetical protein